MKAILACWLLFVANAYSQVETNKITGLIVVCGDSLSSSNEGKSNWTRAFYIFHPDVIILSASGGGRKLSEMREQYHAAMEVVKSNALIRSMPENAWRWFLLEGGHGDLNTDHKSAVEILSDAKQILGWAKSEGFKTMISTVPSSPFLFNDPEARPEAERQRYNTMLRDNCPADSLLDLDLMVPPRSALHQEDGLHFSDTAAFYIARQMERKVLPETDPSTNTSAPKAMTSGK